MWHKKHRLPVRVCQAKIAFEQPPSNVNNGSGGDRVLNMKGEDRASVLFAVTSIVRCHNDDASDDTNDASSSNPYPPLPLDLSSSLPPKCWCCERDWISHGVNLPLALTVVEVVR